MIRKKKRFSRPRKPFESARIKNEDALVIQFGLKNKKEIWKTQAKVDYFRSRAKALAKSSLEDQEVLFSKLRAIGLKVNSIADVLGLKVEDLLNRRLPTVLVKKGLAAKPKQARQFVTHKKVLINNQVIDSPSYLVPTEHESSIKVNIIKPVSTKKTEKTQEAEAVMG